MDLINLLHMFQSQNNAVDLTPALGFSCDCSLAFHPSNIDKEKN